MKKSLVLGQKLSQVEMKEISGGKDVTREEYCSSLISLFNPDNLDNMSQGACEGAAEGARRAGCSFTIECYY